MPCRPLFLLLFCLSLLFFIVALKAEIENLDGPHAPSLKNFAIPIESSDQSSSACEAETGTMTVPQLRPESGFGINFWLLTASLLVFGLLEVAMSASVGKLKSKFLPLLLIFCCLSIVQSELPPQLQRAKECQEVKTLCPCGYGKCILKEWSSASPCCVANYTFEPVFTLCLDFEKVECASCGGHAKCVFVGNQKDNPVSACCPQFYKFQCCPNATKSPTATKQTTSAPFEITEKKYCKDKAKILEICKVCDFFECIPQTGFAGGACCANHYSFKCCGAAKPGASLMSTTTMTTTVSTTTIPTTTGFYVSKPDFKLNRFIKFLKLSADTCQNKSIIKAVCTECDSYRCMPNSVGFSDSGCCPEDNEYRCCSMDRLITKQPTTTSTPLCNKAIIKAVCTECDVYRCIPNIGFHGGGCCYPDHEFRCCSRDAPATQPTTAILPTTLQDVTTTTTETTTTTTEMSTTSTTETEQETLSTEPSSTAENDSGVETISSTTIFCLVMSLWAMERLLPI
uniref:Uncharacterized protein n=1 Tax=Globodera rostochiensis TaxID=31243 RepID=A0A914HCK1_GLORO